ncbi:MAG TPA: hypothetical protein VK463_09020 [Desulfomonilaceae bacterium]|nr:hypothetical protein [Desulfomonilaceae bacterium]
MSTFLSRLVRELLILFACLAVFPLIFFLLLVYTDVRLIDVLISRDLLTGGMGPGGTSFMLWVNFLLPYLVVQAIRSFRWAQRSLAGRKWGNLYFSVLTVGLAAWSFYQAWDLLYFMYEMGDIPAELPQFFELEYHNLIVSILSIVLFVYFIRIFFHPERNAAGHLKASPGQTHTNVRSDK